jgi:dCMP deaminase
MSQERPSWDEYFSQLARMVASRSTCIRRKVGALLVKEERIVATGYNGAPQGIAHCLDVGCLREEKGIPSGYRYELTLLFFLGEKRWGLISSMAARPLSREY